MPKFIPPGMGWIPDLPDARDFSFRHPVVLSLLTTLNQSEESDVTSVDLRRDAEGEYFTEPHDQGSRNSSAACAAISLCEYFERRTLGRTFDGSWRFLYWSTRRFARDRFRTIADTGCDIRTTLKSMARIGVPREHEICAESIDCDREPSSFLYSVARPPADFLYVRLDQPNQDGLATWETTISFLAAGFPVVFGFSVPTSIANASDIPIRPKLERFRGGQVVVAVGYRMNHSGSGQHALLIRNSWGSEWGDGGYGWLPAAYVQNQLARDFWTLISKKWLDRAELRMPSIVARSATAPSPMH